LLAPPVPELAAGAAGAAAAGAVDSFFSLFVSPFVVEAAVPEDPESDLESVPLESLLAFVSLLLEDPE